MSKKNARSNLQVYLGPFLAGIMAIGAVYVYFHQDEDIYEYWKNVERGNVPLDDDDDDDDFDDDDDDDEWEDDDEDDLAVPERK